MKTSFQTYLLFILLLLLSASCSKIENNDTVLSANIPDQESWNFEIIISKKGQKSAVIDAGHMLKYENNSSTYIGQGMTVNYFNSEGEHTSTMVSDSGIFLEKQEHLTAIGHVVMTSDSGYTMLTNTLFWRNDSDLVYTEDNITLYSENDTLYGTGFTSDVRLENWTITKPTGKTYRELDR